ncbi:putative kinesin-like protein [Plasmopara halstedii]
MPLLMRQKHSTLTANSVVIANLETMEYGGDELGMVLNKEEINQHDESSNIIVKGSAFNPEPSASLVVHMTKEVRRNVGKHNHLFVMEADHLQEEILTLRTTCTGTKRKVRFDSLEYGESTTDVPVVLGDSEAGFLCWKEFVKTKKLNEKSIAEAQRWKMQVIELNAYISMQHDEVAVLRTCAREKDAAIEKAEAEAKELRHLNQMHSQEMNLLHDKIQHLTTEINKGSMHLKMITEKWTETQAKYGLLERENSILRNQLQVACQHAVEREREFVLVRDARDALHLHINQLNGTGAAKTAQINASQAYKSNIREYLQFQQEAIQRHAVFRRQVNNVARNAIMSLHAMRATITQIRVPLVAFQGDFRRFFDNLRVPVLTLLDQTSRYAMAAHIEHAPLRVALTFSELTRQHLHEQLWRTRRNAMVICQLQNVQDSVAGSTNEAEMSVVRGNYSNGELLLRQKYDNREEVLDVQCDAIFSDRGREWDRHETIMPLVQSVFDGCNACVITFAKALPLKIGATVRQTVPELILRELFEAMGMHGTDARFYRAKVTISFLAVFNETVYDLLGVERTLSMTTDAAVATGQQIVVLEVQDAEEALMVLAGGRECLAASGVPDLKANDVAPSLLNSSLTHTVVTVCLSFENLLTGCGLNKSKLQIVELALGSKCAGNQSPLCSDNHEEENQRVAADKGIDALVTALADVRFKDVTSVRYHNSELTVLLQDTIKFGAKFLVLVALPSFYSSRQTTEDANPAAIVRILQLMRSSIGSDDPRLSLKNNNHDRSVEGFMNRLALQQSQQYRGYTFPFSSFQMREYSRHYAIVPSSWSTELEDLTKRYDKQALDSLIATPPARIYHKVDQVCEDEQQHHYHTISYPPPDPIDSQLKVPRLNLDRSATSKLIPSCNHSKSIYKNTATAVRTAIAPMTVSSTRKSTCEYRHQMASTVLKKTFQSRIPFR